MTDTRIGHLGDPRHRAVPGIPPRGQKLRVVIDSDAKNEIDDQWAIALAILSLERLQIEGFVAANYDNAWGGPGGIERSKREIELVLAKASFGDRWPVLRGSHPLRYQFEPFASEGVDFILDRAMAASPEDPLWVVVLAAATDMASAPLKEPRILGYVVAFWHLKTRWPEKCYNSNVFGDVRAARMLRCPMEESAELVRPYGELGAYLHEYRHQNPAYASPKKRFFDLGDIAALVEPKLAAWETVDCPEVDWDLDYHFTGKMGRTLGCHHVDRDRVFQLLFDKLKEHYGE
ncbi:MAG: hypothetical protein ACP5G7_07160 [Anaerolineae bacterium]